VTSGLAATASVILRRDLAAVRRSVEAYPDDASLWSERPGFPNAGGTLALHVAGNVRHYVGAVLGRSGYVRDRDAEFSRRNVPRAELIAGLDAAIAAVERTLGPASDDLLRGAYPEPVAKRTVAASDFLVHLVAHLAYHLGQIDYHRRSVTGDTRGVDAVSVRELPEVS
jgi:uncharacterized damage-inducible protein DinB